MTTQSKPPRWPLPPPKGQRCDASTGWGNDQLGAPVIHMCKELAVETLKYTNGSKGFFGDHVLWLCAEHRDQLVEAGQVFRNPKKYPPKEKTSE